jgi:heat shock protein HtpX
VGYRIRSGFMIFLLFGFLFAIINMIGWWFDWSLWLMLAITIAIIGFQYLISPYIIGWIYRIDWIPFDQFTTHYPHLAKIIEFNIRNRHIRTPRIGIIHDGNPNAFTFGHHKNNARVVITDGILQLLDKKEQQAVVAHEMGHVVHSDFIIMTLVSAIPILFYTIARWCFFSGRFAYRGSRDDEGAWLPIILLAVGVISYFAYLFGYLISLIVSRFREYYADEHSAETLEDPNALSTALVKIAYGLLEAQDKKSEQFKSKVHTLRSLGIFDKKDARSLALSSVGTSGGFSQEYIEAAAAWDLHNPWAKYYQIFSTHPLPAKRILALNKKCKEYNITPVIDLSKTKERAEEQAGKTLWDQFLADLFWLWLPSLIFISMIGFTIAWVLNLIFYYSNFLLGIDILLFWAIGFYMMGLGVIARTAFKYRSGFQPYTVADLVANVKVSPIRPVPTIIRGKIIGRGIPGLFYSEDLFFRDETGIIYVDYRFGLSIVDFFWAIRRVDQLIGQKVEIFGWYRRAPTPYVQINYILTEGGRKFKNYSKHTTYLSSLLYFGIGLLLFWLAIFVI